MQKINKRIAPNHITELSQCEIFVFGSNLEGQHMGGAARYAYDHFGAEWGNEVGPQGQVRECTSLEGKERRHISIGAYDTVLSFRNFGKGIALGRMVRHLFPLEDDDAEVNHICLSDFYEQDVFVGLCEKK